MQALRAVFASLANRVTSVITVLQRKKRLSVDDMIVITHNPASALITDWCQTARCEAPGLFEVL
jgi:hypothetical protein